MKSELNFNSLLTDPDDSFVPHLQSTLILRGHNLTPELLKYIGKDHLKEFLIAFGGTQVTFPSWESMEGCIKDAYILWRISQIRIGDYSMNDLCKETKLNSFQIGVKVEALERLKNG